MRCNPLRWLLLGLLLVPVLTYLAVQTRYQHIQDDLRDRTEVALRGAGLSWAGSTFVGRDGLLSGRAIEEGERRGAEQVVRSVWGVYQLENSTNLIDKEDNYVWSAKRRSKELRLSGFIPNKAARRTILGIAKASFPELQIDDRMRYARGVPSRDVWMGGISFALKQLANLRTGHVVMSGLDLSVSGLARNFASYTSAKTSLANRLPTGVILKAENVTPPKVSPYNWSARSRGRQLVLSGYVPGKSLRDDIFAAARARFPRRTIVDRMQTALGQPKHWLKAVNVGLEQLARLNSGIVQLTDRALRIEGVASTEPLASDVDTAIRKGLPGAFRSSRSISFLKPAIRIISPYSTSVVISGDTVILDGYVPGADAARAVAAAARAQFPNRRVEDRTEIAAGAPKHWRTCVLVGVAALGRLGNGSLDMTSRDLVIAGATKDEALANTLAGEVRATTTRKCESDVRIDYKAIPEPNLVWTARWDGAGLLLDGEVPDASTKTALLREAAKRFPKAQVIDRMTVVGGEPEKWRTAVLRSLQMLASLRNGYVRLDAQRLNIRGEARDSSAATAIANGMARDLPAGYSGKDNIVVRSAAMIWAEKEAKRKAALEAERARKAEIAKERAAVDARTRSKFEKQREAERQRRIAAGKRLDEEKRRALEEERARRDLLEERATAEAAWQAAEVETRKRLAEERRRAGAEAAKTRAAEAARVAAAAAALAAEKRAQALAAERQETARSGCETAIRKVASSGTIEFRRARASLSSDSTPTLVKLAEAARKCPDLKLEIEGHTDSDGPESSNLALSKRRASAVMKYLATAGIDAGRMSVVPFGETKPVVPNTSRRNKARNRRIEFNVRLD